jgi:hypothetical protein
VNILSESGCPGFEDLQDGYLDIVLIVELSEYFVRIRMSRI